MGKIGNGTLGAGDDYQVGITELPGSTYIAQSDPCFLLQRLEIGGVRDAPEIDHRDINPTFPVPFTRLSLIYGVLFIDHDVVIVGHHTENRNPGVLLQVIESRLENGDIATKFIDDKPFNPLRLLLQQHDGSYQRGENPTFVNISHEENRRLSQPGDAHIHHLEAAEVYLRRAPCSFDYYDVVLGTQPG